MQTFQFNTSLLSAQDQATLAAALAAIPAVLTPLSAAITQAQTVGAQAINLRAQIEALRTARESLPPQSPQTDANIQQGGQLANSLSSVEQGPILAGAMAQLSTCVQACGPILQQIAPVAQRGAVAQITPDFAAAFNNPAELQNAVVTSGFVRALSGVFRLPMPSQSSVTDNLAAATALQATLTNIEAGNVFFTFGS